MRILFPALDNSDDDQAGHHALSRLIEAHCGVVRRKFVDLQAIKMDGVDFDPARTSPTENKSASKPKSDDARLRLPVRSLVGRLGRIGVLRP